MRIDISPVVVTNEQKTSLGGTGMPQEERFRRCEVPDQQTR
jgi:hypothetical protein